MNKKKVKKALFALSMRINLADQKKSELRAKIAEQDNLIDELTEKISKLFKKLGTEEVEFKYKGKKFKSEYRTYSGLKYDPEKLKNKLSRKLTVDDYKNIIVEQEPKIDKKYLEDLFEKGEISLEDIEGTYEEYQTRKPKVYVKEVD